jgi:flagellar motor switch protein FliN
MTQEEIDALINSGGSSGSSSSGGGGGMTAAVPVSGTDFPSFSGMGDMMPDAGGAPLVSPFDPKLELLYDLQLPVSIELGRTNMLIRDIFKLQRGSVIEFERLASEPVDVLVNGKKIAEGEVVVIDKHFGIRITTILDPSDRMRMRQR